MAIIVVPRSDNLEEFRQKFNQLSELVGDSSGLLGDSPLSSISEYIFGLLSDVDQLQLDLGDVSQISSTGSPVHSVVEAINSLVLPFYDSTGAVKDIQLKIV